MNTLTKVVTTLIGNQSIPTHEIQKTRNRGLVKLLI